MKKSILILISGLMVTMASFGMSFSTMPDGLIGIWLGKMKPTEQLEIRVAFEIKKDESSKLSATMSVIEQKAFDIVMDQVTLNGDTVTILFKAANLSFNGIYNAEKQIIDGHYTQSGISFPLVLSPVDALPKTVVRPQTPRQPFPYQEEEVAFDNKSAGVRLAGTLTVPILDQPGPAIILIAGSGKNDRNGTKMGHFLLLADYLTRNGYIVLRSDKRGVGQSTGDYANATTEDFASDIHAAIDFLKTRPEVDARHIGLIGHSEGAVIAPMVASVRKDVSYIILMGGVGLRGDRLLLLQTRKLAEVNGGTPEAIDHQVEQFERYYSIIQEKYDDETIISRIREVNPEVSEGTIKMLMKPWIKYFTACDPSLYIKKVKCPVLAVTGSKDLQSPPEENLRNIETALKAGRNKHYSIKILPGLNHLFQTAQSGSPLEYEKIEEIIAPVALDCLVEWLGKQR